MKSNTRVHSEHENSPTATNVLSPQRIRLPYKLISIIVAFIPGYLDLLSCSLVCRAWAQVVFPIVHRRITLRTHREQSGTITTGPDLLKQAKGFSPFMRSCVEELKLRLAASTVFTLEMFVEVLDLFPNAKAFDYLAARLPDAEQTSGALRGLVGSSAALSTVRAKRRCLSTLYLHCQIDLEFPEEELHPTQPSPVASTISTLFQFLGLFEEIDVLDLVYLSMATNADIPDPELVANLPRIRTIIKRYQTNKFAPDVTPSGMLCRHLNPSFPVSIQDTSDSCDLLTHNRNSGVTYPSIRHLYGSFEERMEFDISSEKFPTLSSLELKTLTTCGQLWIVLPANGLPDPIKRFTRSLLNAPRSLRDVTLTISIDMEGMFCRNFTFDSLVVRHLKGFDWEWFRSLFKAKERSWRTRKVIFVMERETFMEHDPLKVPLSSEEIRQKLCEEIPALSACTSFEVMQK